MKIDANLVFETFVDAANEAHRAGNSQLARSFALKAAEISRATIAEGLGGIMESLNKLQDSKDPLILQVFEAAGGLKEAHARFVS